MIIPDKGFTVLQLELFHAPFKSIFGKVINFAGQSRHTKRGNFAKTTKLDKSLRH